MSASSSPKTPPALDSNGQPSRMRAHRGNMPSLPQTKYCPLCPAKFTRTTHLNRHLRSHTNTRLHHCDACNSQFTRSDLLTRHKRTCGDPSRANRSRRKSCEACADSKIKCDLQDPCSKCLSRGRQCIFLNDPKVSREKKSATAKKASRMTTGNLPFVDSPLPDDSPSPTSTSHPFTRESTVSTSSSNDSVSAYIPDDSMPTLISDYLSSDFLLPSTSVPGPSFMPSSLSEMDNLHHSHSRMGHGPELISLDNDWDGDLAIDMSKSMAIFDQFYAPCKGDELPSSVALDDFMQFHAVGSQPGHGSDHSAFMARSIDKTCFSNALLPQAASSSTPQVRPAHRNNDSYIYPPLSSTDCIASASELQHYLSLFFSAFCAHVPLIHPHTWRMDSTSPMQLRAMQACGALFAKTRTASEFISETLHFGRDVLIQAAEKNPANLKEQTHVVLTMVLLQTIGLFHQHPSQRAISSIYHSKLVTVIRRSHLLTLNASWTPPDITTPVFLDAAWRDWSYHETLKRALIFSYIHDCCRLTYFGLPTCFHPAELDLALPCESILWEADNAHAWIMALQRPSLYGSIHTRLLGVAMPQALSSLGEMRFSSASLPLNPFALFILIHSVLRNIYSCRCECQTETRSFHPPSTHFPVLHTGNKCEGEQGNSFTTQYALHNWLQSWLHSPDAGKFVNRSADPGFVHNALPFYWLAQVSLLASHKGTSFFDCKPEARFRLVRDWIRYIRGFLGGQEQLPSQLWQDLMIIERQAAAVVETDDDRIDNPDGLLSLFF